VAIGQGYLLTTPLQANAWTNVIANGGELCVPSILKSQTSAVKTPKCKNLHIQPETVKLIEKGMEEACTTGGTGWPLFNFQIPNPKFKLTNDDVASKSAKTSVPMLNIPIACKTGTAEFGEVASSGLSKTHAWFTSFAPVPSGLDPAVDSVNQNIKDSQSATLHGDPEISITVLIESGGEGSSVAAPIAKKIFEYWFSR